MWTAPLAFAAIAVARGKESGWDLQNYHWYNPYALLNHRLGFDIAVAHHATYYNPFGDLLFYLIASRAPAWVAGAYLGFLFGIAVALLGAIAHHAISFKDPNLRLGMAVTLALAGAFGGGAWLAIGDTANDVPVAIGVFAALLILLKHCSQLRQPTHRSLAWALALAGLCAGASAGLKLTTMMYSMGLYAAVLACTTGWRQRSWNLLALSAGMFTGFVICGGYWMLRLWQYGGNPVFPYFNQLFHSALLIAGSYRDPSFQPNGWLATWLYPFYFTADSKLVAEWNFRDAHIAAVYVLLPATTLIMLLKSKRAAVRPLVARRTALFLFVFAAASYVVWLLMFSIYRYLIPLEMLAPLIIAAAVAQWPVRPTHQFALLAAILIVLQTLVRADAHREEWDKAYLSVQTPTLPNSQRTMILMSGVAPMAFAIPSFPPEIPFIRIDGWLVGKDDRSSGLAREMHARVEQHQGPLYMMFSPLEAERAIASAKEYGLQLNRGACDWVRSNIAEPLELCRLIRRT